MPKTGARDDPFVAFRFEISLDDISAGGFSECSGLHFETEVMEYAEGGVNSHVWKLPTRTKQANVTLKRGIVDRELWDWYFKVMQGEVRLRSGSIYVRDPAGQDVMEWQFKQAYPCKWLGPDLNAMQSSVAIESLEICHQGLERLK